MLQTIQLLSLLTSKLRRWSTRMSLLRSSSSQLHSRSIRFCPCSCGLLLHPPVGSICCTVGVTIGTSSSRCHPRPHTSLLGSSIGNSADLFKPRLVSASSGAVCMGSPDQGWRVSPLLLAASVSVLVDSRATSSRGASPLLPDGRPDPTISTPGSLRTSTLASTTIEPLQSRSVCSRCCTSVSSSRCMSSSIRALHSSECGFVTLCAPAARVVQASHSPQLWRSDDCFRYRHHHCRRWWWPHLRLFSDEHPRNSSASSDELIVPLLVCGFPLNSRASQQSTL